MADTTEGRDETPLERLDRNFADLLQEIRALQTGAQVLAGFLLTLPFQSRWSTVTDYQTGLYLTLVALAAITNVVLLTPVGIHRWLYGRQLKDKVVTFTHRLVILALGTISLLVVGTVTLIVDVVLG